MNPFKKKRIEIDDKEISFNKTIAKFYKIEVYDSIGDYVHNEGTIISEIYIPELDVFVNNYNHEIHINKGDRSHKSVDNNIKQIVIEKEFFEKIKKMKNINESIDNLKDEIKCDFKKILE